MVLARNLAQVDQDHHVELTVNPVSRPNRSKPVGSNGGAGRRSSIADLSVPCSSSEALKVRTLLTINVS